MIGDIPRITDASHSHTTYDMGTMAATNTVVGNMQQISDMAATHFVNVPSGLVVARRVQAQPSNFHENIEKHFPQQQENTMAAPARRLVQVFIADPDENVPLDKSLLYTGSQKLTDSTDQELYFEIDIKNILDTHNKMRVELVNKKVKERVEYLEPARVRDLRMVVVNVATF